MLYIFQNMYAFFLQNTLRGQSDINSMVDNDDDDDDDFINFEMSCPSPPPTMLESNYPSSENFHLYATLEVGVYSLNEIFELYFHKNTFFRRSILTTA